MKSERIGIIVTTLRTLSSYHGGVAALNGDQSCVEEMRKEIDRRRKYVISELNRMG